MIYSEYSLAVEEKQKNIRPSSRYTRLFYFPVKQIFPVELMLNTIRYWHAVASMDCFRPLGD